MNSLIQLSRQLQYLFIALLLACFAIAQSARAVTPEADGGDPYGNMAEEGNALLDPSTGTENGAMGKAPNQPNQANHKVISIKLTTDQCACDRVELNGELHMQFRVSEFPVVGRAFGPANLKLENFRAKPLVTSREYKADNPVIVTVNEPVKITELNEVGTGEISVGFLVTGRPRLTSDACPKSIIKFLVTYTVIYEWKKVPKHGKQVTGFNPGRPKVKCFKTPAP